MQVKNIVECSKGTFIKLPFAIKTFVLSIYEWLFCTDFSVFWIMQSSWLKTWVDVEYIFIQQEKG